MNKKKILPRKVRITVLKSMAAVAVCLTFAYPFFKGEQKLSGYYEVSLNGKVLGAVSVEEDAKLALKDARYRITSEAGTMVYINPELTITEKKKLFGTRMKEEELEEVMYTALKEIVIPEKQQAYTVKINETVINLGTKEEVLELLEATKNRFDTNNEFTIELVENTSNAFTSLTTNIVQPKVSANERAVVFASEDGAEPAEVEPGLEDGLKSVEFEQKIEVIESYVKDSQLITVQEAYDEITKEKEENEIYEVQPGDCISIIAEKTDIPSSKIYELNGGITENTLLQIGQELVITVPEPELSVLTTEEITYSENYQAEVIYIDNNSWYTTEQVIQQQGTEGHRAVTALVNTRNGREISREIINQKVVVESLPTIIERGTITPPTYIKPIVGGTLTSYYGQRWGRLHAGVDWGISTGSTVMASCGGQVISAGWNGGYGYSILIQHPDGKRTRYAHLSKILVSAGQYVKQGEKIGLSGNTGNSTGPHLHFEILINGSSVNPFNYLN